MKNTHILNESIRFTYLKGDKWKSETVKDDIHVLEVRISSYYLDFWNLQRENIKALLC